MQNCRRSKLLIRHVALRLVFLGFHFNLKSYKTFLFNLNKYYNFVFQGFVYREKKELGKKGKVISAKYMKKKEIKKGSVLMDVNDFVDVAAATPVILHSHYNLLPFYVKPLR